jgi:hypothetical protein
MIKSWFFRQKMRRENLYESYTNNSLSTCFGCFSTAEIENIHNSAIFQYIKHSKNIWNILFV